MNLLVLKRALLMKKPNQWMGKQLDKETKWLKGLTIGLAVL